MQARYTWRKGKTRDGMMRLPPSYSLHCGSDEWIVKAQQLPNGRWFWYGQGVNTAHAPDTLEAVKAAALAHVEAIAKTQSA